MANDFGVGLGSTFGIGNGASPEVFATLAKVISITPPSASKAEVEVTNLQSPNRFREFILGLRDSGEVAVKVRATNANLTAIYAEFAKDVDTNYKITSNTELDTVWDFAARLMNIQPGELSADNTMELDLTFKVSGDSTISQIP